MEFDYYSRSSLAAVVYGMVRARRRQTTAEKGMYQNTTKLLLFLQKYFQDTTKILLL